MCTVTYIPQGKNRFILTTNRDENAARSPKNITVTERADQRLAFPRDTEAGGTWIAVSDSDKVVCVLNGAFERHRRQPPYKRSRGLMALDFFDFRRAGQFFSNYEFEGIEPFTMVTWDNGSLYDFRWDGQRSYLHQLDAEGRHIWSSATLYDQPAQEKRRLWFAGWEQQYQVHNLEAIMDFHRHAGAGDQWNGVIMNRMGMVQTVSITNIIKEPDTIEIRYHDLLNEHLKKATIDLQGEVVGTN